MDEIEKAEQELNDALTVLAGSARELSNNACVNGSGHYVVARADMLDMRQALERCLRASANHIIETARKPQAEADAEKCKACQGTGKALPPAFWPTFSTETFAVTGHDPDDLAVAYAALIKRAGGFPRIAFVKRGDAIVGIEVRDTRTGRTVEPTRVFDCQPMGLPTFVESAVLKTMAWAVERAVKR